MRHAVAGNLIARRITRWRFENLIGCRAHQELIRYGALLVDWLRGITERTVPTVRHGAHFELLGLKGLGGALIGAGGVVVGLVDGVTAGRRTAAGGALDQGAGDFRVHLAEASLQVEALPHGRRTTTARRHGGRSAAAIVLVGRPARRVLAAGRRLGGQMRVRWGRRAGWRVRRCGRRWRRLLRSGRFWILRLGSCIVAVGSGWGGLILVVDVVDVAGLLVVGGGFSTG